MSQAIISSGQADAKLPGDYHLVNTWYVVIANNGVFYSIFVTNIGCEVVNMQHY